MSVDTYLKGKKTAGYRRIEQDDVMVLLAPSLMKYADRVELVTRKKLLFGQKLIAIAYQDGASCQIGG